MSSKATAPPRRNAANSTEPQASERQGVRLAGRRENAERQDEEAASPSAPPHPPSGSRKAQGNLGGYLRDVVGAAIADFDADAASVWLRDLPAGTVRCVFHEPGRLPPGERRAGARVKYRFEEIPSWQSLAEMTSPTLLKDCAKNPMLAHVWEWFAARGVEATLLVPIRDSGETLGWLLLFHQQPRDYPPILLDRAARRGRQLSLAVKVVRAAVEEKEAAVVAERERIARELHDTLAQGFTAILLQFEAAKEGLGEEEKAAAQIPLERAREIARESLAEARRSVWAMRPRALDQSDLPTTLEWLVRDMAAGSGVAAEFSARGARRALTAEIETNLLRIIQEAVSNALRHARARTIRVQLTFGDDYVKATVEDDGRGFVPAEVRNVGGFGLVSMRGRAESLSGKLRISSHPARGTRVLARIPITKG